MNVRLISELNLEPFIKDIGFVENRNLDLIYDEKFDGKIPENKKIDYYRYAYCQNYKWQNNFQFFLHNSSVLSLQVLQKSASRTIRSAEKPVNRPSNG